MYVGGGLSHTTDHVQARQKKKLPHVHGTSPNISSNQIPCAWSSPFDEEGVSPHCAYLRRECLLHHYSRLGRFFFTDSTRTGGDESRCRVAEAFAS